MSRLTTLCIFALLLGGCSGKSTKEPTGGSPKKMGYLTTIDQSQTLLLIDASVQAYNAFDSKTPAVCQVDRIVVPAGYEFVDSWSGVDSIYSADETVETYGVVFRSQESPHTYVFAFRGTDSVLDLLDDTGLSHVKFSAFNTEASIPNEAHVERGFHGVYTEATTKTPSMQQQLFALVDKYNASDKPISRLCITGHSLGAALSTLFTLDVGLSRPDVNAVNFNFASPRVGNDAFVTFYEQQPAENSLETRTVRIQNTHDKVPCVPLAIGYRHTSPAYLVAFTKSEEWYEVDLEFVLHNHSALNYQAVLKCAFNNPSGVCVDDASQSPLGYKLRSKMPDQHDVCRFW